MSIADVKGLDGTAILLRSGNLIRFENLGPGGLRAFYHDKPTDEDIQEVYDFVDRFVLAQTGDHIQPFSYVNLKSYSELSKEDKQKEIDAYQKFLKGDKE